MGHVFIISTGDRDHHGTRVNMDGWDLSRYQLNPIVLWSDTPLFMPDDPDTVIGYSRVWLENKKLYAEWVPDPHSPIAGKLIGKLNYGTSLGASVNFIPHGRKRYGTGDEAKGQKNETIYFAKQELIAWKVCALPSNGYCVYQRNYEDTRGQRSYWQGKLKLAELKMKYNIK